MATYSGAVTKNINEINKYTVDFTNDLSGTIIVSSGTATHVPPSGSASSLTISASSPYVYVTFGTVATLGQHYIDVLATLSDSSKSSVRIPIDVVYPTATARSGMANLIGEVRGMTEATSADYTIAGVPYWTDSQIQDILDINRRDFIHAPLQPYPIVVSGGTLQYYEYRFPYGFLEQTSGGTSILYIQDSTGATAGTSLWSADYRRGVFTFASNTAGTTYYLTGRSYDLQAAAADMWRRKAGHYAPTSFDFSTDNHSISREQVYSHCIEMSNFFDGISGGAIQTVERFRSDM